MSRRKLAQGMKFDDGKDPWDLMPTDAERQVVRVLGYGARKYAARNWEKGIKFSRLFAAAKRHLVAWHEREELDAETGLSHLAHAACDVLFLLAFVERGMAEFDDRPPRRVAQKRRKAR